MKPNRIILIRHGESHGNINRSVYNERPDYALELTDCGIGQAIEAGNRLKELVGDEAMFFYVSPMWRTRMTFEKIAHAFPPSQYRFREEPRIREQDWGHLRDLDTNALVDKQRDAYGTFYYRIPDGESAADVYDRVSNFFDTLHRDFEKPDFPPNCVLVTHGMTLRLFLMRWFHWTPEKFESVANPSNCEIVTLEKQPDNKYRLTSELRTHKAYHTYQRPIVLP